MQCQVEGCVRTDIKARKLCNMHLTRYYKHGDTSIVLRKPKGSGSFDSSTGYRTIWNPTHLLAMRDGRVYEHRLVAFETYGYGPHLCYWCKEHINWNAPKSSQTINVDHLDWNKLNNNPDNLVLSCRTCNNLRRNKSLKLDI